MVFSLKKYSSKRNEVAFYEIGYSSNLIVPFTKDLLITFYYLSQFQYFTREQANTIYNALSGRKLIQHKWFSDWTGNRNYPISKLPKKSLTEKDVLYINKHFGEWIVDTVSTLYPEYIATFTPDQELQKELFDFFSNYEYGRPRTINVHDTITRDIVIGALSLLLKNEPTNYNIAVTFPKNRRDTYILPDAIISYKGKLFYIEYDNYTETQARLLNKVITYSQFEQFKHSNIFFVFKSKLPTIKETVSTRIIRFLSNIENSHEPSSELFNDLKDKDISVYGFPLNESSQHIYSSILLTTKKGKGFDKAFVEQLIEEKATFLVSDISVASDNSLFDFYVLTQNDFYEDETIPFIFLNYGKVGNNICLETIYNEYHNIYNRIGLIINNISYPNDHIPIPYDNYFVKIAHSLGE